MVSPMLSYCTTTNTVLSSDNTKISSSIDSIPPSIQPRQAPSTIRRYGLIKRIRNLLIDHRRELRIQRRQLRRNCIPKLPRQILLLLQIALNQERQRSDPQQPRIELWFLRDDIVQRGEDLRLEVDECSCDGERFRVREVGGRLCGGDCVAEVAGELDGFDFDLEGCERALDAAVVGGDGVIEDDHLAGDAVDGLDDGGGVAFGDCCGWDGAGKGRGREEGEEETHLHFRW